MSDTTEAKPVTDEDLFAVINELEQRLQAADVIIMALVNKMGGQASITVSETAHVMAGYSLEHGDVDGVFTLRLVEPRPAWQTRVIVEKQELDAKLMRLRGFLSAPNLEVSVDDEALLIEQANAMQAYSDALAKRIESFGVAA